MSNPIATSSFMVIRAELDGRLQDELGAWLRGTAVLGLDTARRSLGFSPRHRHRGVHEARKAIRRLRALLILAEDDLGRSSIAINLELRAITRDLSSIRDAHVVTKTIERLLGKEHTQGERASLRHVFRQLVLKRDEEVIRTSKGTRGLTVFREQLHDTRLAIKQLPWEGVSINCLHNALHESEQRADARGKIACKNLGDLDKLHVWRRKMRRLRHQLEFLGGIPKPLTVPMSIADLQHTSSGYKPKEIAKLTDLIGEILDLSLLEQAFQMNAEIVEPRAVDIVINEKIAHQEKLGEIVMRGPTKMASLPKRRSL